MTIISALIDILQAVFGKLRFGLSTQFFFVSNSFFWSRLELLVFWANMRLKVAMELLRFLTDFGTKYEK